MKLQQLGIAVSNNKTAVLFEKLYPDFLDVKYNLPSQYISMMWERYEKTTNRSGNQNGRIFEYLLATLCIRENILPLYMSAKVAFVPNVIFNLMFYTRERGPICWSVKTSLRERYKQADLESIALKYVHRKSLSYLITLNSTEAESVRNKIKTGDVIGLDDVIVATSSDFDVLVENLKTFDFEEPPTVKVIESNQIVTVEKVKSVINN